MLKIDGGKITCCGKLLVDMGRCYTCSECGAVYECATLKDFVQKAIQGLRGILEALT